MKNVRRIAVTVAAGTALAVGAGTVGFAVAAPSATKSVTACANKYGRLALKNSAGKCAKGFTAVTINKQGPKGATGAKGAKGATGAQGPGARAINLSFPFTSTSKPLTVDGYSYHASCDASGTGVNRVVTVRFYVAAPSGKTVSLTTVYQSQTNGDTGELPSKVYRSSSAATQSFFLTNTGTGNRHLYNTAMQVIGSDGKLQILSLDMLADGDTSHIIDIPCSVVGTVTPAK